MKRYLFILLALMIPAFCAVTAKDPKGKMAFEEYSHNFGTIKESAGPVTYEFNFVNAGDGNLSIIEATAQCGCTKPSFPKAPIAPGKTGKVKVTYNPAGRPGAFSKTITVRATGSPSKAKLKITGTVTR